MNADEQLLVQLVRRNLVGSSIERPLLLYMKTWGCDLFTALLETHMVPEAKLADMIAEQFQIPRFTRLTHLGKASDHLISFEFAHRYTCIPFFLEEQSNEFIVAHFHPREKYFAEAFLTQFPNYVKYLCVAEKSEIMRAIVATYPLNQQMPNLFR